MLICPKYKIVFVAPPKTGTRTIYYTLKKYYEGHVLGEHARIIPKQCEEYFSFVTVRNPYDRACSAYWHACHREQNKQSKWYDKYGCLKRFSQQGLSTTLENFLIEVQSASPRIIISHPQYLWHEQNHFNRILRLENLQEDFNSLPFIKEHIQLPFANSTTTYRPGKNLVIRPSWKEMIDKTTGQMINEIYAKDFELLGYERIDF